MPYKSAKQRAFFHTDTARKAGISAAMVKEYDEASKGKKLPKYARKHKKRIYDRAIAEAMKKHKG
jgi:hypothetical protein